MELLPKQSSLQTCASVENLCEKPLGITPNYSVTKYYAGAKANTTTIRNNFCFIRMIIINERKVHTYLQCINLLRHTQITFAGECTFISSFTNKNSQCVDYGKKINYANKNVLGFCSHHDEP